MTTAASYGLFAHTSNATLQAWATELHNLLVSIGLTQTADTGQTNTATITWSSTANASLGYEIWRFNDTLQATAPIYFKLEYASAATNTPAVYITVGTGSDGAGTITGIFYTRRINGQVSTANAPVSTTTQYLSQAVYNTTTGHLGVFFKQSGALMNGSNVCDSVDFIVARTCDSSGNPTATGVTVIYGTRNSSSGLPNFFDLNYNFSTGYTQTAGTTSSGLRGMYWPYVITNTIRNGQAQLIKYYTVMPDVSPIVSVCGCLNSEISAGSVFTATVFGVPHTYLALGVASRPSTINNTASYNPCILWE